MKSLITILSLVSCGAFAGTSPQTFSARVPADPRMSCDEQASEMANRISNNLKVKISDPSSCIESSYKENGTSYTLRTINIHYSADVNASSDRIYRANYSEDMMGGEPSGTRGIYPTYLSCVNDIKNRELEYSKMTGLEVLASGCAASLADSKFTLRITGFGRPKMILRILPVSSFITRSAILIDETASILNQIGAQTAIKLDAGILYYAPVQLFSQDIELNLLANENECLVQKSTMDKFYQENGEAHSPASCLPISMMGKNFYALRGIGAGQRIITVTELIGETYYSFDECMLAANERNLHPNSRSASFCKMTDRPVQDEYANPSYTVVEEHFQ